MANSVELMGLLATEQIPPMKLAPPLDVLSMHEQNMFVGDIALVTDADRPTNVTNAMCLCSAPQPFSGKERPQQGVRGAVGEGKLSLLASRIGHSIDAGEGLASEQRSSSICAGS